MNAGGGSSTPIERRSVVSNTRRSVVGRAWGSSRSVIDTMPGADLRDAVVDRRGGLHGPVEAGGAFRSVRGQHRARRVHDEERLGVLRSGTERSVPSTGCAAASPSSTGTAAIGGDERRAGAKRRLLEPERVCGSGQRAARETSRCRAASSAETAKIAASGVRKVSSISSPLPSRPTPATFPPSRPRSGAAGRRDLVEEVAQDDLEVELRVGVVRVRVDGVRERVDGRPNGVGAVSPGRRRSGSSPRRPGG